MNLNESDMLGEFNITYWTSTEADRNTGAWT